MPGRVKILLLEAVIFQYLLSLFLRIIPFNRILNISKNPDHPVTNPDSILLQQIKEVTKYANHLALWKNKCLVMSLAARLMLKKRNISSKLYLGVDGMHNQIVAHAWLEAANLELVSKNGDWMVLNIF